MPSSRFKAEKREEARGRREAFRMPPPLHQWRQPRCLARANWSSPYRGTGQA